ncbi:hypothetical protein [Actinoallomurus acaciae]|uniref:TrbL/VirB6 plasmid conjugal transfer protein n=1 Tax=Actinoallomurus acaciae TaxID=502577 RepID=A0ABV5Y745_9ACTN
MLVWWMSDNSYSVRLTGEKGGLLYSLREHTNYLTVVMAFAGFMIAAIRIAVQRNGEPFRVALSQFFQLAVIVLTLATVVNLGNIAGDRYSYWILKDLMPKGDTWIENWKSGISVLGGHETDTSFLLAFFALAATVGTSIQFGLMLFRSGALIVLVGTLPPLAAARFTTYGDHAYRKCLGWLISFVLFKPVAATIYAAALKLLSSKSEADRLFGLALIAGAVFALPATMRAIMPAITESHSAFGIRQVGHFVFGSSAVNAGKGVTVLEGAGGAGVAMTRGAGRVVGRVLGLGNNGPASRNSSRGGTPSGSSGGGGSGFVSPGGSGSGTGSTGSGTASSGSGASGAGSTGSGTGGTGSGTGGTGSGSGSSGSGSWGAGGSWAGDSGSSWGTGSSGSSGSGGGSSGSSGSDSGSSGSGGANGSHHGGPSGADGGHGGSSDGNP